MEHSNSRLSDTVPSFEDNSSFLSWIQIGFLKKVVDLGKQRPLQFCDLGSPSKVLDLPYLRELFQKQWKRCGNKNLVRASFLSTTPWDWILSILFYTIGTLINFLPSMILEYLLKTLDSDVPDMGKCWIMAFLLFLVPACAAVFISISRNVIARVGVRMKLMLEDAIFQKTLRLSAVSRSDTSTGQLINLLTSDTGQIIDFTCTILVVVIIPIALVVCSILVSRQLGILSLLAITVYTITLFLQSLSIRIAQQLREAALSLTDHRIKSVSEALSAIRLLKVSNWEPAFCRLINTHRSMEIASLRKLAWVVTAGVDVVSTITPSLVPVICFSLYSPVTGLALTPSTVFTSLSLFKLLNFPFAMIPYSLNCLSQFAVSANRIADFLNLPEMDPSSVDRNRPPQTLVTYNDMDGQACQTRITDDVIQVEHGYFSWNKNVINTDNNDNSDNNMGNPISSSPCLQDISFLIPKGALVGIAGKVGSGKSSLFAALLGEMHKHAGLVATRGTIAYSEQQPWLLNDTIQANILFTSPMRNERYSRVLRACCLEDDLLVLDGGDLYHIQDHGSNVSGGQRARISLARCCYSKAEIVLLDDPLAAVDARVAKRLFQDCIQREMAGRTRLLISSSSQVLSQCDIVLQVEDHTIRQISVSSLLAEEEVIDEQNVNDVEKKEDERSTIADIDDHSSIQQREKQVNEEDKEKFMSSNKEKEGAEDEEKKAEGHVPWKTYIYYLQQFGWILLVLILLSFLVYMICTIASTFLLSDWSAEPACRTPINSLQSPTPSTTDHGINQACLQKTQVYMQLYILLFLGKLLSLCARSFLVLPGRFRASFSIHSRLTTSLLYAPMHFHDRTPTGRILNRFSKDMNVVDTGLPTALMLFLSYAFDLGGDVITITASTNLLMLVVLAFSFILYIRMQKAFQGPNTDILRLEAISKSPVLSRYQSAIRGSMSLHAYESLPPYIQETEQWIVQSAHLTHLTQHMSTYLTWRSDLLAATINSATAIVTLLLSSSLSANRLGAALTSSSGINGILKYLIQQLVTTEANMNAMDRVREYAEDLPQELSAMDSSFYPPSSSLSSSSSSSSSSSLQLSSQMSSQTATQSNEGTQCVAEESEVEMAEIQMHSADYSKPFHTWPTYGQIEFDHLQFRYDDSPLVLKNVTLSIHAKEKIGVIGRTGAGKSSLTVALFRLREQCGGSIRIDGVNTQSIPLRQLRNALAIIPQDPVLFATSLRFNLDPLEQFTDEQVWSALDCVGLCDCAALQRDGLQTAVEEGGQNFSVGERQLLCAVRVILRKPTIVVMDEATASLDEQTLVTFQQMIDREFKDSTVISIAHRLNTILQCDRVCVMNNGQVAEYNSPQVLQHQEDSLFRKMLMST